MKVFLELFGTHGKHNGVGCIKNNRKWFKHFMMKQGIVERTIETTRTDLQEQVLILKS